jgi:hypothetical protein
MLDGGTKNGRASGAGTHTSAAGQGLGTRHLIWLRLSSEERNRDLRKDKQDKRKCSAYHLKLHKESE